MVVQKKDGGVCICGDFKVTINPVICPQVYPLPTPEEMFSALANGETFTRLNLARAYRQMKVKPECQHLLTINTHLGLSYKIAIWHIHSPVIVAESYGTDSSGFTGGGCFY